VRSFCGLLVLGLLCACARPAYEDLADSREALAEASYADAIASADAGLAVAGGEEPTTWGLQMVKLEALARSGRAEETKALFTDLAGRHPERFPSSQYAATAGQLDEAGQGPAAIEILDLGMKQHPGDPLIAQRISAHQTAGVGSAELDMLRTLGYVE
jgi:hypothetical protein